MVVLSILTAGCQTTPNTPADPDLARDKELSVKFRCAEFAQRARGAESNQRGSAGRIAYNAELNTCLSEDISGDQIRSTSMITDLLSGEALAITTIDTQHPAANLDMNRQFDATERRLFGGPAIDPLFGNIFDELAGRRKAATGASGFRAREVTQ